jgi:hypothetical protein
MYTSNSIVGGLLHVVSTQRSGPSILFTVSSGLSPDRIAAREHRVERPRAGEAELALRARFVTLEGAYLALETIARHGRSSATLAPLRALDLLLPQQVQREPVARELPTVFDEQRLRLRDSGAPVFGVLRRRRLALVRRVFAQDILAGGDLTRVRVDHGRRRRDERLVRAEAQGAHQILVVALRKSADRIGIGSDIHDGRKTASEPRSVAATRAMPGTWRGRAA